MKHVIIYVPGLGDKMRWLVRLQKWALNFWRVYLVKVEVIIMVWSDPVPLKPRFDKLLNRIDELHAKGKKVHLVGTSAGASAVISALVLRQKEVSGVVTICGKLQGDIPDAIEELNPSFGESLHVLAKSLKQLSPTLKERILTIYSPLDAVVPPSDAVIEGVQKLETRALGHNLTCAYVLLCKPRQIIRFLKNTSRLA
jgi:predicted alpha/beta hydrolase family esterase